MRNDIIMLCKVLKFGDLLIAKDEKHITELIQNEGKYVKNVYIEVMETL